MSWLSAMPLLSTLAALVIIVHSAEEMERERGWSSREAETGILDREVRETDYEQPWRAIDAEPILQPTTTPDAWVSSENAPRRRRFSRKRKRRPQMPDGNVGQDKPLYQGEQRRPDTDYRDTNQALRRRRLPTLSRAEETDVTWAKRGVHNRRPSESYDTWIEPEDFEHDRSNERLPDMKVNSAEERFLDGYNRFVHRKYSSDSEPKARPVLEEKLPLELKAQPTKLRPNTDKSLSEFSSENRDHRLSPRFSTGARKKTQQKSAEAATPATYMQKPQPRPTAETHAVTIKEILKRSKGKSLSEILEQHKLSLSDLLQGKINPLSILKTIGETSRTKVIRSNEGSQQKIDNPNEKQNKHSPPKFDNIETEPPETLRKTYNKVRPDDYVDSENIQSKEEDQNLVTTTETNQKSVVHVKNGTFVHPALLKQKKRPKQRISLPNKTPPNRQTSPKPNNTLNPRKHAKMGEWREILPKLLTVRPSSNEYQDQIYEEKDYNKDSIDDSSELTTTSRSKVTTTTETEFEETNSTPTFSVYTAPYNTPDYGDWVDVENSKLVSEVPETTTTEIITTEVETELPSSTSTTTTTTTTPKVPLFRRPTANSTVLRQQAYSNRMKKKRLQHKSTSTPIPENILNETNLQTSSEFIEKNPSTTSNKPTTQSENEIDQELTTDRLNIVEIAVSLKGDKHGYQKNTPMQTTEKTAKNEIEEILNDTRTSAKLSRILFERNMTLGELLEHRERGSSQVHLADIFHNASKEPSAAEPFLSKSSIEPMSKETYPLRAILENHHDSTTRLPNQDFLASTKTSYFNIPVVMDFGNNVNENAENMGIMSLFNNYTKSELGEELERTYSNSDSDGTPYISSIAVIPANETRDGRHMKDSWNDLFAIIKGKHKQNSTIVEVPKEEEVTSNSLKDNSASDSYRKPSIEDDADGDGLIILEDLQRYDPSSTSKGHVESNVFHRQDDSKNVMEIGTASKASSTTRSVTVATASIIGLAMVLFLLTYALLKWNQQRHTIRDKRFGTERISTPVFENHKELPHNNSCRSINSMMSSNIYTVDGFESNKNGKESPVYMWDDLKKPFQ